MLGQQGMNSSFIIHYSARHVLQEANQRQGEGIAAKHPAMCGQA
jgi:hypothetical protein